MKNASAQVDGAIAALIPAFLKKRLAELEPLREMAEEQEWARLLEHAHRLKGVGLPYGFAEISAFGDELTQSAEREDHAATLRCIAGYTAWLRAVHAKSADG